MMLCPLYLQNTNYRKDIRKDRYLGIMFSRDGTLLPVKKQRCFSYIDKMGKYQRNCTFGLTSDDIRLKMKKKKKRCKCLGGTGTLSMNDERM